VRAVHAVARLAIPLLFAGGLGAQDATPAPRGMPPLAAVQACREERVPLYAVDAPGIVGVLGRFVPGVVARERAAADTGRFAGDSARVIAVEHFAADAPAWARAAVRQAGGRLPVIRLRPPPGCDPGYAAMIASDARRWTPPDDSTVVFQVYLRADTVEGRVRALAWVPTGGLLMPIARNAPRRLPGDSGRAPVASARPSSARWLEWWDVAGALGARQRRDPRDTTLAGDPAVARRVVAWSERHRDSAAALPVLQVVERAREVLRTRYLRTVRSPFEGTWDATVTTADGVARTFRLEARMARLPHGVAWTADAAEPLDSAERVRTLRRRYDTPDGWLGPPGWTPRGSVHALRVELGEGGPPCADPWDARGPRGCVGRNGRLEHDVVPLRADADSVVYASAVELGTLAVFMRRREASLETMFDTLGASAGMQALQAEAERIVDGTPRALRMETRQGRCVLYRRSGAARCTYRGMSWNDEVMTYDLRRAPSSRNR
jgi:hypothetical protein